MFLFVFQRANIIYVPIYVGSFSSEILVEKNHPEVLRSGSATAVKTKFYKTVVGPKNSLKKKQIPK